MPKRPSRRPRRGPSQGIVVERSRGGDGWVLVHPAAARDCAEDLEEVRTILAAGEADVAIDELRWLLGVCHELLEAHYLLGKLAVEALDDAALARGHFGVGFELVDKALRRAGDPTPLPALHPANRPFYDCGRGLAWCLAEQDERDLARDVVRRLRACDPSDPLGLAGWLDDLDAGGAALVTLG